MESALKDFHAARSIVPLGEFKTKAASILKTIDEPMIITQNGRAAAVILSPAAFEEMRERLRFLDSIAKGLADAEVGRTVPHEEVRTWLDSWGSSDETDPPRCR